MGQLREDIRDENVAQRPHTASFGARLIAEYLRNMRETVGHPCRLLETRDGRARGHGTSDLRCLLESILRRDTVKHAREDEALAPDQW
jgi:hypothetical protein